MADSNGNFWKDKFFYIVLLLLIGSFGWATAIFFISMKAVNANETKRVDDNTKICSDIVKGDKENQIAFLLAFKDISAENKKDMKEVFDKISAIQADVMVIKQEIKKR